MKKLLKNYIVCLLLAIICLVAAVIFAPIWNWWESCPWRTWGADIVNLLIAACIVCYLVFYLAKKLTHGKRVIKVLTIVEFSILSLIALGCIFSQFNLINVKGACQIFGLALWTRGSVELFRAYYHRADSKEYYPVWYLAVSIALVTFGTFCVAKPFIQDVAIIWIFAGALLISGALLLTMWYNQKPVREPKPKAKKLSTEE